MPDALTPPQGLIAVTERRTIYGFPMGIGSGGGGTKVITSLPPAYAQGGGMKVLLIGEYTPAVRPPVVNNPTYTKGFGAGTAVSVITPEMAWVSAGCRAVVIPDESIIKCRQGCVQLPASVDVTSIE